MGKNPRVIVWTTIGEPQNIKHAYSCRVIIVWMGKPTLLETTNVTQDSIACQGDSCFLNDEPMKEFDAKSYFLDVHVKNALS